MYFCAILSAENLTAVDGQNCLTKEHKLILKIHNNVIIIIDECSLHGTSNV